MSNADQDDYPAIFRLYVTRGLRATLDAFDAAEERLDETRRERGLHLLSYGLRLDDAWGDTRDLALALAPHLERQGYRREWMALLAQALAQAAAQGDDRGAAQLHLRLGRLHILLGDYAAADAHLTQAQQLAETVGDRRIQAMALEQLGFSAFDRADLGAAQAYAEASLAIVEPDSLTASDDWHILAWVAVRQGNFEEGIERFQRILALNRSRGHQRVVASALRDLGATYLYAKCYDLAINALKEAIDLFAELRNSFGEAMARMNLGIAHWYLGEHSRALTAYAPCEMVFQQTAGQSYLARLYNNQGLVHCELDNIEHAKELFGKSVELARNADDFYEAANAFDSLAGLHLRIGDITAALAAWQEALAELARLPEPPRYLYNLIQERMAAALQQR